MPKSARQACIGLALLALGLIAAVYVSRIFMALPIYAGDEGAYLIRALYSPDVAARNPNAAEVDNTVFFVVIRLVHLVGESYMKWLRALGLAAYAGGLLLTWRATTGDLNQRNRMAFLLLAFAFPYYRFVVTTLPEGWFVGVLGLIVWVTATHYRYQPLRHALLAGALCAALVLVKPHGIAVVAALGALMIIDPLWSGRGFGGMIKRLAAFGATFLAVGVGIQAVIGDGAHTKPAFFVADVYGRILRAPTYPNCTKESH